MLKSLLGIFVKGEHSSASSGYGQAQINNKLLILLPTSPHHCLQNGLFQRGSDNYAGIFDVYGIGSTNNGEILLLNQQLPTVPDKMVWVLLQ